MNASSSHGLPVSRALSCARSLSVSDAVAVQRKADVAVTQHHLLQMVRVCDVLFLLRLLGPTLWSRSTALFRWFVSAWSPCSCLGYGRLQQHMHGAGTLRQRSLRSCKAHWLDGMRPPQTELICHSPFHYIMALRVSPYDTTCLLAVYRRHRDGACNKQA